MSLSDVWNPGISGLRGVRAAAAALLLLLPSPPKWADMYDEYIQHMVQHNRQHY